MSPAALPAHLRPAAGKGGAWGVMNITGEVLRWSLSDSVASTELAVSAWPPLPSRSPTMRRLPALVPADKPAAACCYCCCLFAPAPARSLWGCTSPGAARRGPPGAAGPASRAGAAPPARRACSCTRRPHTRRAARCAAGRRRVPHGALCRQHARAYASLLAGRAGRAAARRAGERTACSRGAGRRVTRPDGVWPALQACPACAERALAGQWRLCSFAPAPRYLPLFPGPTCLPSLLCLLCRCW